MCLGAVRSVRRTLQHRLCCWCGARGMLCNVAREARLQQPSNVQQRQRAGRTVWGSSMQDARWTLPGRYPDATIDAPYMHGRGGR